MNTVEQNRQFWDEFDWNRLGEEWSVKWGNSNAQWHFSLRPRIARHIPCDSILEIAIGYGRWTRFLVNESRRFVGFDLVEKCTQYCRDRFSEPNRTFVHNDGLRLTGVKDRSIDLVFSFDSLVHANWETIRFYLSEILRVLRPGGFAFIHHSNAATIAGFESMAPEQKYFRAPDVSASKVRDEVVRLSGGIFAQEIIDWGSAPSLDCLSTIATEPVTPIVFENRGFMTEAVQIAKVSRLYTTVPHT